MNEFDVGGMKFGIAKAVVTLAAVVQTIQPVVAGPTLWDHESYNPNNKIDWNTQFILGVERDDGVNGGRDGLLEHRTLGTHSYAHSETGTVDTLVRRL